MSTRFVTNLNLNQNQLLKARFEVLPVDPNSDLFEGWIYFNSTSHTLRIYADGVWRTFLDGIASAGSASTALTVSESGGVVTLTPNLATSIADGVMSASDKAKLDDATSEATASKLVIRDVSGNIKVATPTDPAHAATKAYVDAARSGLDVKPSVRVATTGPVNISTELEAGDTLDTNVTLVAGNRVLVKNQGTASENGIYVVQASGAAIRAADANGTADTGEVSGGTFTFVEEGLVNADSGWVVSSDGSINVGADSMLWSQFSGAGQITAGEGLDKDGNILNVNYDNVTIYVDGSDDLGVKSSSVQYQTLVSNGSGTTAGWGAVSLGESNAVSGTLPVGNGGTGQTSFTDNGIVYGNAGSALDVTAAGTQYQVLQAGSGGVPEFAALSISSSVAVTGQLAIANGGTSASTASGARDALAAGGTQGDGVSVPTLSRKVTKIIGNGVDASFVIQHGFGTRDVMVQVYDSATYDTVISDVVRTDTNNVTVLFSAVPLSNAYTVIIIG